MTRTIVNVQETWDEKIAFWLQYALGDIPDFGKQAILENILDNPIFGQLREGQLQDDTLKLAGEFLFQKLSAHHPVEKAITLALAIIQDMAPIFIHVVDGNEAESWPWEILCNNQVSFLALDPRWPIGRIASSAVSLSNSHIFDSELRLMVILAAAQVDATPEWQALYQAVAASPLNIRLRVLVCQDNLKTAIEALNKPGISVDFLPIDINVLLQEIGDFAPNILHFFCHGSTVNGPHLQLASRNDWLGNKAMGSVTINAQELSQVPNIIQFVWLVTLNCCQGAAMVEDASSLARSLVSKGIPAVIGMRETVTSNDANLFCRSLYASIMKELQACLNSGKSRTQIEWAKTLLEPRKRLAQHHGSGAPLTSAAAKTKQWTLPIIYVRPEPFELEIPQPAQPLSPEERLKLELNLALFKQFRDTQRGQPDLPPTALAVLAEIDTRISELETLLKDGGQNA
jgi:hypothetical protein